MAEMFAYTFGYNEPLTWDTSSVTDMTGMFAENFYFISDLSFDASSLLKMTSMFQFSVSTTEGVGQCSRQPVNLTCVSLSHVHGMAHLGFQCHTDFIEHWLSC